MSGLAPRHIAPICAEMQGRHRSLKAKAGGPDLRSVVYPLFLVEDVREAGVRLLDLDHLARLELVA